MSGNPSFANSIYPLLSTFCVGCHTSSSATAQQPYFASSDMKTQPVERVKAADSSFSSLERPTNGAVCVSDCDGR